jgi:rhodanese-related sulfurtransferase
MSALDYFKARIEATVSPMDVARMQESQAGSFVLIDVRIGPKPFKAKTAIEIPQNEIVTRMSELPKDKLLVLYCWETWCSLAVKAAIPLLEAGFNVKEMYGGIAAWKALDLPTEAAEAGGQSPR